MISRRTSSIPKKDVFSRLLYSDSRCSQACCRRSQMLPGLSLALPGLTSALADLSLVLQDAPKVSSGAPSCSPTDHSHSLGTPVPVIRDPSHSKGRPECPPRVWYSPEIDASKFSLHILSNTPGGFQWLNYILMILWLFGRLSWEHHLHICL